MTIHQQWVMYALHTKMAQPNCWEWIDDHFSNHLFLSTNPQPFFQFPCLHVDTLSISNKQKEKTFSPRLWK